MDEQRSICARLPAASGTKGGFTLAWVICLAAWLPFGTEAGSPGWRADHPGFGTLLFTLARD
jgi:hypothetical protein